MQSGTTIADLLVIAPLSEPSQPSEQNLSTSATLGMNQSASPPENKVVRQIRTDATHCETWLRLAARLSKRYGSQSVERRPRPVKRSKRTGALMESQEHRGGWMSSLTPITLNRLSLFTIPEQHAHRANDAAPSRQIPDLSFFKAGEIDAMYEKLISKVDELQIAYAGLVSHLFMASEVSTETESLLSKCFFLQHNLAGQFEMLGMNRCAYHSRVLETRLALFPPIHRQYPLHELSSEASQQIEQLWASSQMLYQLITSYGQHMAKETLPLPTFARRDPDSCAALSSGVLCSLVTNEDIVVC